VKSSRWHCAACAGENPAGTKFCGHCGSAAANPAPVTSPRTQPAGTDVAEALRSFVDSQVAGRMVETADRSTEERRLVTALFADLSGFTRLAERLDPERLTEVIDPIVRRLSNIVGRYEGYVEKFAGDALLAFFGAPVSHEDDAARALLVALEMHRELGRMLLELPPDARNLELHIGINSGHVIARVLASEVRLDYAVLGDAVILAQRLESAAPAGATYVGESTYLLTRGRFDFEPVGELTLKGKVRPVPAWRLLGERVSSAGPGHAELVGRERELATLTTAIDSLSIRQGGVVCLTGEAGVGKSRLTAAVQEWAEAARTHWLETRCLSYGKGLAYWPWADLLRRVFDIRPDTPEDTGAQRLATTLEEMGLHDVKPYLTRLLGLPTPDAMALEPEAFRRGLHAAIASLLRRLARDTALIVVLEDMHWADPSSVELTKDLALAFGDGRLILYLTGRPEAGAAMDAITGSLPEARQRRLELEPLGKGAISTLVRNILDGPPAPDLEVLLAERTGGNPFFVEEIVRSLQESGALVRRQGLWETVRGWLAESVPPTIEGAISARIDLLPRNESSVLQVASVVGRRVRVPLVHAVASDLPGVNGALEGLVDRRFLDRPENGSSDSLFFHHALTQEVAYSRLLRRQRRDLHRKVAEAAEALYGAGEDLIDLLARHLYLGDAGAKALDYLLRAAQRAKRLFANEEAILHLGHAAEVVRGQPELGGRLPRILLDLAQLHERQGNYDDAFQLYFEVRGLTNDLDAWRGLASIMRKRGQYAEALSILDQALALAHRVGADPRPLWLERAWCLNVATRLSEAVEAAQAGLAASSQRDPITGYLLLHLTRAATVEGRFDDAVEHGLEAQRIFEQYEDLPGLATAMRFIGSAYYRTQRLDDGAATLRRGLHLAERVGNAEEIAGCLINLGLVELQRGNLNEAIACDHRAIAEFERIGHSTGRATAYANLAEKLVHRGDYAEAARYCDQALAIAHAIDHTLTIADAHRTIALICLRRGDLGRAASEAQLAADLLLGMRATSSAARAFIVAAEATEKAGDSQRAAELRARAHSLSEAVP